jgi:hypothetical protein
LGYVYMLGWITDANIFSVDDRSVDNVNDLVTLSPFDITQRPQPGQVVGVKISLAENSDDIYLSYRATTAEGKRGLFVVFQDKESPDSKLMDAACHSMSQQDAFLREGWTYMDTSQKIVIVLKKQTNDYVDVLIYRTPRAYGTVAKIRSRQHFTDGRTKCPRTCQDSDLAVSQSCPKLKTGGYCNGGTITTGGRKLKIGLDICPNTCGNCGSLPTSPNVGAGGGAGGCADQNIMISGMSCRTIARKDLCGAKTSSGQSVGTQLCPKSCGKCPRAPPPAVSGPGSNFPDPEPARKVGTGGESAGQAETEEEAPAAAEPTPTNAPGVSLTEPPSPMLTEPPADTCKDDVRWKDTQGFTCEVYKNTIPKWGKEKVCHRHNAGIGGRMCRKSCGTCEEKRTLGAAPPCKDDEFWKDPDGNNCAVYSNTLAKWGRKKVCEVHRGGVAKLHCKKTCDTCPMAGALTGEDENDGMLGFSRQRSKIAPSACADNTCVGPWMEKFGRCYQCEQWAHVCEDKEHKAIFQAECPLTCGLCEVKPEVAKLDATGGSISRSDEAEVAGIRQEGCEDDDSKWCQDLGFGYCSEALFANKCKATCERCPPPGTPIDECMDRYSQFTCGRYVSYGWCERKDTMEAIRLQCPVSCGVCGEPINGETEMDIRRSTTTEETPTTTRATTTTEQPTTTELPKRSFATVGSKASPLVAAAALCATFFAGMFH